MVCDTCGKKQATVHLTEIINNKMSELHLCDSCAQEKGAVMKQHFSLADLLAGLSEIGTPGMESQRSKVCTHCGLSYSDFKKIGRLGCSECYGAFREGLAPLLKRIHGSTRHIGTAPERTARTVQTRQKLQVISKQLERAIELEEYEEAARLRDELRRLEKGAKKSREKSKGDKSSP